MKEESTVLVFLNDSKVIEYQLPTEKEGWRLLETHQVPGKVKSVVTDWYFMNTHFIMYKKKNSS